MKYIILALALTFVGCHKAPPNLTPTGSIQFKADQVITALSDFQDGISISYDAGWLSKDNTFLVAQILGVTFVAIHSTPQGAKKTAIDALQEMENRITPGTQLDRFKPYIDQVRLILAGL